MEITYIELPPKIPRVTLPFTNPTDPDVRPKRNVQSEEQAVSASPLPTDSPAQNLQPDVADDRWQEIERMQKAEGVQFARNKLTDRYNPIQTEPPGRFRMRPQLSLAEFMRAV